jgi:hypothetical protein
VTSSQKTARQQGRRAAGLGEKSTERKWVVSGFCYVVAKATTHKEIQRRRQRMQLICGRLSDGTDGHAESGKF